MRTRTVKPDDGGTLVTMGYLINAGAESGRVRRRGGALPNLARGAATHSRSRPPQPLTTPAHLAVSLVRQGKHAQAAEAQRKVLVSSTHMIDAEYEHTLISAFNLAVTLWHCGKKNRGGAAALRDAGTVSARARSASLMQGVTGLVRQLFY